HRIWEPAAGRGAIVDILRDRGHEVITSDIADYGFPLDFQRDFLEVTEAPAGCECIVTNPPFKLAEAFVARSLRLVSLTLMLLRLNFLESERRRLILEGGALAKVHVLRNRLPMLHRDGWTGRRASSAIPYAWFAWHRNHCGPIQIDRIS